jgi:hypothetical protein
MFVRARHPLSAGQELTFSYCDPLDPLDERRGKIQAKHRFICNCDLCRDQQELVDTRPDKAQVGTLCAPDKRYHSCHAVLSVMLCCCKSVILYAESLLNICSAGATNMWVCCIAAKMLWGLTPRF